MNAKLQAVLACLLIAASGSAMAYHDCGSSPGKVKRIDAGEYVSLWKGNNWKGHVFVVAVAEQRERPGTFWMVYPGSKKETVQVKSDLPALKVDAPSNGAELRAVFETPTLVMVCALRASDETPESITARLLSYRKACGANSQCWLDQGKQYELPHSSIIFPKDDEMHDH